MLMFMPDAQIHVLAAHGGTTHCQGIGLCLSAPFAHTLLIAIALEGRLILLLLLELGHAPDVQIRLLLQILQVGLIL